MAKNIVWLASYPKSGNTWTRLFLYNYLFNPNEPSPINEAHRIGPSDATAALYRKLSKRTLDPTNTTEILALRPEVISAHSSNGADVNFMKTHNANTLAFGRPLIPAEFTRSAIYILRNPLDMAVSFAHHYGLSMDKTAEAIGNSGHAIYGDETLVHQFIGNWSKHVKSWTKAKKFKVCTLRYEDMLADPEASFGKALKSIGAPSDPARLRRAIEFSSFAESKKQEQEHGFVEQSQHSKTFFRSGKAGEGRKSLPQSAIDKITADHGDTMRKFGYLD